MLAPTPLRSVEALLADDPATLDDAGLRENLAELARLRARIDAVEATTIVEFDRRDAYVADGMVATKTWLVHHTGVASDTAGARTARAKRLRHMPLLAAALAEAEVTVDHVRAMSRCLGRSTFEAFVRDETMLTEHAIAFDADDFALVVSKWLLVNDPGRPDSAGDPSELYVSSVLDGRHRLDGELDVQDSAEFLAELDTVYDELWRQDRADAAALHTKPRPPAELRAAALVEIARRSSGAGDRDTDPGDGTPVTIRRRTRRPQLVVVVDPDALAGDPAGTAELDDGTPIPQQVLQQWACDSALGRVVMSARSIPFDLGRITYTATDGQRRILAARDKGCVVPGCKRKARWCEAHHIIPWPHGPTNIRNLVLLCRRHHKQVHQRIIKFLPDEGGGWVIARGHDNTPLRERPPPVLAS